MIAVLHNGEGFQKPGIQPSQRAYTSCAIENLLQSLADNCERYRIAMDMLYSNLHKDLCKDVITTRKNYSRELQSLADDLGIDPPVPDSTSLMLNIHKWILQARLLIVLDELHVIFSELHKSEQILIEEYEQVLEQINHPSIRSLVDTQLRRIHACSQQMQDVCSALHRQ